MAEKKSEFDRRKEAFEKSYEADNWNEAIQLGDALRQDFPDEFRDTNHLVQLLSSAYYNRALANRQGGGLDEAIADYTQAIELNPDYTPAYYNRGIAYAEKGEYDTAIADYDKAIELKPDNAAAYYNRGTIYFGEGEYDRAIADFDKAIALNPDYTSAYYNRGNAYLRKEEYDTAIADFDKVIEINPNFAEAYNNKAIATGRKIAKETEERLRQSYEERLSSVTDLNKIEERFSKRKKQAFNRLRSLRSSSDRLSFIIIFTLPLIWALLAYFLFFYCAGECGALVNINSFWTLPGAFASITLATFFLHLPIFLRIAHRNRNARIERHVLEDYERKIVILNLSEPGESVATILKHIDKRGTPEVLNRLYHPKYAYPHKNNAKDEGDDEGLLKRLETLITKAIGKDE